MNWFDRLLMVAELLVLLKMLRLDTANSQAIQRFLTEREKWYARRALQPKEKTPIQTGTPPSVIGNPTDPESLATGAVSDMENEKAPEINPELGETVAILQESELEQTNSD